MVTLKHRVSILVLLLAAVGVSAVVVFLAIGSGGGSPDQPTVGLETQPAPPTLSEPAVGGTEIPDANVIDPGELPLHNELALTGSDRPVTVDFQRFSQLIPRDAIEPVYFPQFMSADEARLGDDALVIGLSINGESKAYPIGPLNHREMVNDVVGGVPVLVTW